MADGNSGRERSMMYGRRLHTHDITVGDIGEDPRKNNLTPEAAEIVKEIEQEIALTRKMDPANGLSVGTGVGILVCVFATLFGIQLATRDVAVIIAIPALLGVVAGYLFS